MLLFPAEQTGVGVAECKQLPARRGCALTRRERIAKARRVVAPSEGN